MVWVVTADTARCRIYQYHKKPASLELIKELTHPKSQLKGKDLTTDKTGHYKTPSGSRGAFSSRPSEEPKEIEADIFSREIAHELEKAQNNHQYKTLIMTALPHMQGLLNAHLKPQVKNAIIKSINKDYMHMSTKEVLEDLLKALKVS